MALKPDINELDTEKIIKSLFKGSKKFCSRECYFLLVCDGSKVAFCKAYPCKNGEYRKLKYNKNSTINRCKKCLERNK